MGKTEEKKFKYVDFNIEQKPEGIYIDQNDFAEEKIEVFDVNPDRSKNQDDERTADKKSMLRKCAGKVGWLARGSRPDLVFAQIEMSTKFVNGKVRDLVQASKVMRRTKSSESSFYIQLQTYKKRPPEGVCEREVRQGTNRRSKNCLGI